MERSYIAIDLKSFYASVECTERGMDPLDACLVVADEERTEKTICLAVTPALKAIGIPGRARLFEVIERVRQYNAARRKKAPGGEFSGASFLQSELMGHPELEMQFKTAAPRMSYYMDRSTHIFNIYRSFVSEEDIHVYSIDEVFIDATAYLNTYRCSARELAMRMIHAVLEQTGITATAGIGTNLYLAKIAMDIVAKHMPADADGVRIAQLDEMSYREQLWSHRPLTDFWRVGRGIASRLEANGMHTMGDVARCSLGKKGDYFSEELLYRLFGVSAELLIDHAWGYEPCTIADIKAYRPDSNSFSSGQVLPCPYDNAKARLAVREMAYLMSLQLVEKRMLACQAVLTVIYDPKNLSGSSDYGGPTESDYYGRTVPKHANGSKNLQPATSSAREIIRAFSELFDGITNHSLLIRRIYVTAAQIVPEDKAPQPDAEQLDLFTDYEAQQQALEEAADLRKKEKKRQLAVLDIKKRFGTNAIVLGMNLEEGATAIKRGSQIGGHKA